MLYSLKNHVQKYNFCLKIRYYQAFCFFLRYTYLTPIFGLRRARLNGIITSPCPEVSLDTFGFPVYARSAARRVVSWQRLPKMALFEPFFGPSGRPCVQIAAGLAQKGWFFVDQSSL